MTLQASAMNHGESLKEKSILSAEDFPVKAFQWQENDKDFQILEEHCFLKLQEPRSKSNHAFYCLKTLQGYYHTTRETRLLPFFGRFMSWGMMCNGKCVTAKIMESPKIERAYTLLDIVENQADPRYSFSPLQIERTLQKFCKKMNLINMEEFVQSIDVPKAVFAVRSPRMGYCKHENIIRLNSIAHTLLAKHQNGVFIIENGTWTLRYLTPKESWRLQGQSDTNFFKAQQQNSNTQLYKQAGNSVTVDVVAYIAKQFNP